MKVISLEGDPLDSEFTVEANPDGQAIVLESRGPGRNSDYTAGLQTLLRRLSKLDAVLQQAFLDTTETRKRGLSQAERVLHLPAGNDYPLALREIDIDELVRALKTSQRAIGQPAGATGGNETRRMVMVVKPGGAPLPALLEAILAGTPRMGIVYVPASPRSTENLRVGVEWGVWGFSEDVMERSTYLQEFQLLREGDFVLLGHHGPTPRVPRGGWVDARLQVGHLGVITGSDQYDTNPVWPDGAYPYRLHVDFLSEYRDFGAASVGTDVMEALRLSANQQGRVVVHPFENALLADGTENSANPLALDGPLDKLIESVQRREQSKLRRRRLGSADSATCDLCGRELPVRYLRMAHIKKRSLCSHDEKRDPDVVMTACIECDALFETKELVVDAAGVVRAFARPDATPELQLLLAARTGRTCAAFSSRTSAYFAFHRR